jgi:hypothetical protein
MNENPMSKKPWDINDECVQKKILQMISKSKPEYVEIRTEGEGDDVKRLNNFISDICMIQNKNERTFVVSQPVGVSLTSTGKLLNIRRTPGVHQEIV